MTTRLIFRDVLLFFMAVYVGCDPKFVFSDLRSIVDLEVLSVNEDYG